MYKLAMRMVFEQIATFRFIGLLIVILLFFGITVYLYGAQEAPEEASALGELKLEGKYINRLVLRRKDGHTETFDRPMESIILPVGKYRLLEVHLKGGYIHYNSRTTTGDWMTIAEDEPRVFKVGAPLKQTVKARRQGMILVLNYELLGVGGEIYTGGDRHKPPTFVIYRGENEIASGEFVFG